MRRKRLAKIPAHELSTERLLFVAWLDEAARWKRIRSGAALARCLAARAAWYQHVYGEVPPVHIPEEIA